MFVYFHIFRSFLLLRSISNYNTTLLSQIVFMLQHLEKGMTIGFPEWPVKAKFAYLATTDYCRLQSTTLVRGWCHC